MQVGWSTQMLYQPSIGNQVGISSEVGSRHQQVTKSYPSYTSNSNLAKYYIKEFLVSHEDKGIGLHHSKIID